MAKYSRFDPRNQKKNRNKTRYQNKDFRIKYDENSYKKMTKKVDYEIYDEEIEMDISKENSSVS